MRPLNFRPSFAELERQAGDVHLLVSRNLRHSRTYGLYNGLFAARGAAAVYLPYEVTERAELDALLAWAPGRVRSLLVSDPWKGVVATRLPELSAEARATGAVNLVLYDGGRAWGTNLDGPAAWEGLGTERVAGVTAACFLGCGGVSTAVALSAPAWIERMVVVDRAAEAAALLAGRLRRAVAVARPGAVDARGCGLVYNGTGLGKAGGDLAATPVAAGDRFDDSGLAWDANYTPAETAFLAGMRARGWATENGASHVLGSARFHLRAVYGWEVGWDELRGVWATRDAG